MQHIYIIFYHRILTLSALVFNGAEYLVITKIRIWPFELKNQARSLITWQLNFCIKGDKRRQQPLMWLRCVARHKTLFVIWLNKIMLTIIYQVGSSNWSFMSRSDGAVWDTSRVPQGALQFRLVVTAGYDGKWIWAKKVLPADWKNGLIYDSGLQITDIAQEGCSPCDDGTWS